MAPDPGVYKDEPAPAGDPHHPHHHPPPGPIPPHLQHSRPSSIVNQQHHPNSPHQPSQSHPGAFPSPHSSNHGLPLQHQSPYAQPGSGPNGQPTEVAYYAHPTPYGTPVSGQYSASGKT
ncbi:MAG: hypothetical protein Q9190_004617 [Brigantiaea leucoxantha]